MSVLSAVPFAEVQGSLALDLAPYLEAEPVAPTGTAARHEVGPDADVVPIDRRERAETERWARHIVQAALEVVGGVRPSSQLVRWLSPTVYADLRRRTHLLALASMREPERAHPVRARLQTLHASYPTPGVLEAAARVRHGQRSRAVAARFERRADRGWVCTALDFA
ncbi:MAG: Rv3235 family protein [Nocardioides sp.]|jgi:hypothetical protein|uniref:Rv3235 family protein n=1 Tax=Nocardioides sp. TaxID=35761 RepID=UPI00260EAA6D|nr:Rv3235 family protein [Nocardioides sp.]